MKKNFKRLLTVVMALAMVFAMGTSAFAGEGDFLSGSAIPPTNNANCASYLVTTPTAATSANVTLVVEAGDAFSDFEVQTGSSFRAIVPVTLTSATAKNFTVADVLSAANNQQGLTLNVVESNRGPYLKSVEKGDFVWEDGQLGFDGWVFRVNDKYPVVPYEENGRSGYQGTAISQTYVQSGDVIHLFYDFPSQLDSETPSCAANYVRGVVYSQDESSLTIQMQGHKTDIGPTSPYIMSVNNYTNLGSGVSVQLCNANGTSVATGTTDANGRVTFTGEFAAGQNYIITSTSTPYICPSDMWAEYTDGVYFDLTGAYSKITL